MGAGAGYFAARGLRMGHFTMRTTLRPAHPEDFDYCARLYFEGMERIIKELSLLWADAVEKNSAASPWNATIESSESTFRIELAPFHPHFESMLLRDPPNSFFDSIGQQQKYGGAWIVL